MITYPIATRAYRRRRSWAARRTIWPARPEISPMQKLALAFSCPVFLWSLGRCAVAAPTSAAAALVISGAIMLVAGARIAGSR